MPLVNSFWKYNMNLLKPVIFTRISKILWHYFIFSQSFWNLFDLHNDWHFAYLSNKLPYFYLKVKMQELNCWSKSNIIDRRFCPYMGKNGSTETRILAYFTQWTLNKFLSKSVDETGKKHAEKAVDSLYKKPQMHMEKFLNST